MVHKNVEPRVALASITGLGAVTASGATVADLYSDVRHGRRPYARRPVAPVANALPLPPGQLPAEPVPVLAAHVTDPLPLAEVVGARADRTLSRDSRLLIHAAHQARTAAGGVDAGQGSHLAVYLGTLRAGHTEYLAIHDAAGGRGGKVNPVWGPNSGYNMAAAQLSVAFGAEGPNITFCAGIAVGLDAVVAAARAVYDGTCSTAVAAGLDTLCAQVDTTVDGEAPAPGSSHVVAGEAAAALILEDSQAAADRAVAHVLAVAEVTAVPGGPADADAPAQAITDALMTVLREARCDTADLGLVMVSTSGHDTCDRTVFAQVARLLAGNGTPVCDIVTTTGRTGGADGALAVVLAAESIRRGHAPDAAMTPIAGPVLCVGADPHGQATALLLGPTAGHPIGRREL
jgi:3-oxoacyl-[acyl-carrier-protein] synthase II